MASEDWQPFKEPLRATLARTGAIAAVLGAVLVLVRGSGFRSWPAATLIMLWPALGGHFIELLFLNGLRPRLPSSRVVQATARTLLWFAAGCGLAAAMYATALAIHNDYPPRWPAWWIGGIAFIGIELIAHLVLQLRGQSSFYNGRG